MKKTLLIFISIWLASNLLAQDKKTEKAISKAKEEADGGNCEDALARLNKLSNTDSSNATLEYLKAKCNYQLQQYDESKVHITRYFKLQNDTSKEEYAEMKGIAAQLNIKAGESFGNRDTAGLVGGGFNEQQTWDRAFRTHDIKAYRNYIRFFPNGPHIDEAKQIVDFNDKKENNPSRLIVDAVKQSNWKLIKELLDKGADINYVEVHKNTISKASGEINEYYFETPLSIALMKFDYTMVKYFLEQGADPNRLVYRRINDGDKSLNRYRSILENMIIATSKNGVYAGQDSKLVDFIDLMLHYGLDLNLYKGGPISTAVYFHDPKKFKRYLLIRYLLRKGADPSLHGDGPNDESAIQIARSRADKTMVTLLKDKRYKDSRKKYQERLQNGTYGYPVKKVPATQ